VTVRLTATDNPGGSGVKQLTFSATGAQPIAKTTVPGASTTVPAITAEGVTRLTFFATDQTGNTETAKALDINIDKTPPEAVARFDPAHHDLVVLGRDAGSGVSAEPLAPLSVVPAAQRREGDDEDESEAHEREVGRGELRTYRVQDAAGNILRLTLDVRATAHQLRAEVASLQYDAAAVVMPPQNQARFAWQLDQAGHVRELKQTLRVGGERERQAVQAEFRTRDNQTRIEVQLPRPEHTLTRPGLALLELVTSKGALQVTF
jgi:hypothetical protein